MNSRFAPLAKAAAVAGSLTAALVGPVIVSSSADAAAPTCFGKAATIVDSGYVLGTQGADVIVATAGSEVHGLGGNDRICGSALVYAGRGDDQVRYAGPAAGDWIELSGGDGNDRIYLASAHLAYLYGGLGHDRIASRGGHQWVTGGPGNDTITAGLGPDDVYAGPGADIVHGNDGNDRVDGGPNNDVLYGDTGNDRIWGGTGTDIAYGGPGTDTCDRATEKKVNC